VIWERFLLILYCIHITPLLWSTTTMARRWELSVLTTLLILVTLLTIPVHGFGAGNIGI